MIYCNSIQKHLILTLLALAILTATNQALASTYISLEELNGEHPEQSLIVQNFKAIVAAKGIPIAPNTQTQPVRIAFIYPGKQLSDYWKRSVLSFKRRMDEIGLRYELSDYFSQPGDIRLQEAQLRKALATKPDYLVYTLDMERHKRLVERLIHKGKPKVILQNITTPVKEWHDRQPFLYVGFDHVTGTRMLAAAINTLLPQGGTYGVLFHSRGYISKMRGDSFIHIMNKSGKWKLKDSYYTDGDRKKAKYATLDLLQDPELKLIYSCSTDISFGAIDGLTKAGKLSSVILNGWGGGSSELQAIRRGNIDLTIMRINDDNGIAMAEAIHLDVEGKTRQVPIVFSGDFAIVTKDTSEQQLQVLKERSFRYSGSK